MQLVVAGHVLIEAGAHPLGVAHLAEDPSVGEVMPSTAQTEPLGLKATSMVGAPERSTYWVAICPFSAS